MRQFPTEAYFKKRFMVLERDDFTCQYCGRAAPTVVLEVDHRVPVAEGGGDEMENLTTSCSACNRGKGGSLRIRRILEQKEEPLGAKVRQIADVVVAEALTTREIELRTGMKARDIDAICRRHPTVFTVAGILKVANGRPRNRWGLKD